MDKDRAYILCPGCRSEYLDVTDVDDRNKPASVYITCDCGQTIVFPNMLGKTPDPPEVKDS